MKKDKKRFEQYAKKLIDFELEASGQERVFEELCFHAPKVKKLGWERFFEEYIPAKLALGCGYWRACCEDHEIEDEDKEISNVFFREVMKRFETPNSLPIATRFSEYLYAANANEDESPTLAIVGRLFDRLKIDRIVGGRIAPGFLFMMEASDALKNGFENEFDNFICADEDFRVS